MAKGWILVGLLSSIALGAGSAAAEGNIVAGSADNSITTGVNGGTISGGGSAAGANRVTDDHGTVGGGLGNRAGDDGRETTSALGATVAGGVGNVASGNVATIGGGEENAASGGGSTVAGGADNSASGTLATVGGGANNTASGEDSTVAGGENNEAPGPWSVVAGGSGNEAHGDYSFAAGRGAVVFADGSFAWADSTTDTANFINSVSNSFLVRASGGFQFYTSGNQSTGAILDGGESGWSTLSDREAKADYEPVDGREILGKLASIPIETWHYEGDERKVRHIGPVSQDFHAAFEVGFDKRYINTVDADGVAMAAIQGLFEIVKEKDAELEARLAEKDAEIGALREIVDTMKTAMAGQQARRCAATAPVEIAPVETSLGGAPTAPTASTIQ